MTGVDVSKSFLRSCAFSCAATQTQELSITIINATNVCSRGEMQTHGKVPLQLVIQRIYVTSRNLSSQKNACGAPGVKESEPTSQQESAILLLR